MEVNWEIDDGLTVEDYLDMQRKRRKKYPICENCLRQYVKTQENQSICLLCQNLKNGLKYAKIELISVKLLEK